MSRYIGTDQIIQVHTSPNLPPWIKIGWVDVRASENKAFFNDKNHAFRQFLKTLNIPFDNLEYCRYASGKPYLMVDGKVVSVSVSHTEAIYLMALNIGGGDVGIDVESRTRPTHSGLEQRIRNIYDHMDPDVGVLEKWTIKESILKMTGTGLRTGMNKVTVQSIGPGKFISVHDNYDISIVSLNMDGYYIAVAWTTNHK